MGMERTLGLLQERHFWPKMANDVCIHICTCDQCTRFRQHQEKTEKQPILVSYALEIAHLDFLTLGGKQMTIGVLTSWLSWTSKCNTKTNNTISCSEFMGKFLGALWIA